MTSFQKVSAIIILYIPLVAFAQSKEQASATLDKLYRAYDTGKVSAQSYMDQMDSLTGQFLSDGVRFAPEEFSDLLRTYEEIAWSKPQYTYERFCYYLMQLNNARTFDYRGASMYYAEKATQEYKRYKNEKAWFELGQKLYIYAGQMNLQKIIDAYENELDDLEDIPRLIREQKVTHRYGMDALSVFSVIIMAYGGEKDTSGVYSVAALVGQIIAEIRHLYPLPTNQMLQVELSDLEIQHAVACFEEKYEEARKILIEVENLKSRFPDVPSGFIDLNLVYWRTGLFLHLGKIDSASYYLGQFEQIPYFADTQKGTILRYKSQLEGLKGNSLKSREYLEEALKESDNVQGQLIGEMDDLLYAQTQSEHDRLQLIKSENTKHQRLKWIVGIVIFGLLIITYLIVLMRQRDRKLKRVVDALNESANLQVLLIEEAKSNAKIEEQHRISQEIHDDLAGNLITIRNHIILTMDGVMTSQQQESLDIVNELVEQTYQKVRTRSHFLAEGPQFDHEKGFEEHIQQIAKAAFPSQKYTYNISIEPNCLDGVSYGILSDIIRLLQEAFANILKHAIQVSQVDVVLHCDGELLTLEVQDNGTSYAKRHFRKGMGLKNMERRVMKYGGEFTINSYKDGTMLKFLIPIQKA